ncbi:MAG TPA: hypothetical protein VJG32_06955 [Anaerolineae bacterium]|nr:hypothetical protein [Anaerolineae bacterium]
MKTTLALISLALILTACGGGTGTLTGSPPEPTTAGDSVPVAPAPTDTPASVDTQPTAPPPTDAPTEAPTATATQPARPRPTATSSGPLDFQFYVAGCRNAPTAEKPDNVVITISVEATGGNGVYRYFHRGVEEADKFIDVEWGKNTRLNGEATVTSGDGQSLTKEYDIRPSDHCPSSI